MHANAPILLTVVSGRTYSECTQLYTKHAWAFSKSVCADHYHSHSHYITAHVYQMHCLLCCLREASLSFLITKFGKRKLTLKIKLRLKFKKEKMPKCHWKTNSTRHYNRNNSYLLTRVRYLVGIDHGSILFFSVAFSVPNVCLTLYFFHKFLLLLK